MRLYIILRLRATKRASFSEQFGDHRPPLRSGLPNMDALFRFEVKLFKRFHRISLVPCVDVANGLGAFAAGSMLVGDDLRTQGGIADLLPPALGKGEKEALVAGEAVDYRQLLAVKR